MTPRGHRSSSKNSAAVAEDLVAGPELFDPASNRFDPPRDVGSEDPVLGSKKPGAHEPDEKRVGPQMAPVVGIHGGGADLDQQLTVPGNGSLDLLKPENVRRPEFRINDGFHFMPSPLSPAAGSQARSGSTLYV